MIRELTVRNVVACVCLLGLGISIPAPAQDPAEAPTPKEMSAEALDAGSSGTDSPETGSSEAATSTDVEALRATVEARDRIYVRAARERDQAAFRELLAKDVIFLADEVRKGRLGVLTTWQPLFDGKYDFRYEAEHLETVMAESGEFALTVGSVRTSFTRPGLERESTDSFYMNIWVPHEGDWLLQISASLVVHPVLGSGRDPRSGLMTAWPELADQIGASISIDWAPELTVRAASGELAYSFGEYEASFDPPADEEGSKKQHGKGHFIAVWQKDSKGAWQLAAEGFTPPGIYHSNDG